MHVHAHTCTGTYNSFTKNTPITALETLPAAVTYLKSLPPTVFIIMCTTFTYHSLSLQ